jgi:hypothetical protein
MPGYFYLGPKDLEDAMNTLLQQKKVWPLKLFSSLEGLGSIDCLLEYETIGEIVDETDGWTFPVVVSVVEERDELRFASVQCLRDVVCSQLDLARALVDEGGLFILLFRFAAGSGFARGTGIELCRDTWEEKIFPFYKQIVEWDKVDSASIVAQKVVVHIAATTEHSVVN